MNADGYILLGIVLIILSLALAGLLEYLLYYFQKKKERLQ